jgi:hypothetical protein
LYLPPFRQSAPPFPLLNKKLDHRLGRFLGLFLN